MESSRLLDSVKRIHFVGIGGSGMCPLAEILFHRGFVITGSDTNESDTLERVRSYGIPVHMGHRAENIGDAQLVVYTAAVKQDNPELIAARERASPQWSARCSWAWSPIGTGIPSPFPAPTARPLPPA